MTKPDILAKIESLKEARRFAGDNMRKGEINRELMYFAQKLTALED